MKTVIVESPYKPLDYTDKEDYKRKLNRNLNYARLAARDCLYNHNEAPFLSHLIYPQFLNDKINEQRELGMHAGREWFSGAYAVIFYIDLGMSEGMKQSEELAKSLGMKIEYRTINDFEKLGFDEDGNLVECDL